MKRLGKGFLLCLLFSGVSVAFASIFNQRPSRGPSRTHDGYDYPTAFGTPVPSRGAGTVSLVEFRPGYGKTVAVDKGRCREIYAHFSSYSVSPGQRVSPGTLLGLAGRSGHVSLSKSTAVVHYEPCSPFYPLGGDIRGSKTRVRRGQQPPTQESVYDYMLRDTNSNQ